MVDRLEELLAQMADEDDEEQEDVLAPEAERAAPAAPAPGDENQPESRFDLESWEEAAQEGREAASAPAENGELWAAASRVGGERPPEDDRPASVYENQLTATHALGAGDGRAAEGLRLAKPAASAGAGAAAAPGTAAERGLEGLYRRTAQAGRPAAQSLPVEQAGRTRYAEEPGRAAALTVDELDRAVRRDSRRYDGGMSIF